MEKQMSINRLLLILLAALLLPGLALAQSRATFAVTKIFSDSNTSPLTGNANVTITCNTGLPLTQSKVINAAAGVTFVVESFVAGTMNCNVTEATVPGYTAADYQASGTGSGTPSDTVTKCTFSNVGNLDAWACEITNDPTPVAVIVNKEWVIEGQGGDSVDSDYTIRLNCGSSEIVGGTFVVGDQSWHDSANNNDGTDDTDYTFLVVPNWQGTSSCSVFEDTFDSAIDTSSDCGSGAIHPVLGGGGDNSCTFINTVFFEGIPTLSQYGMAILALLMLGVGFVGFRRFV
jgi:hypothetical protein